MHVAGHDCRKGTGVKESDAGETEMDRNLERISIRKEKIFTLFKLQ